MSRVVLVTSHCAELAGFPRRTGVSLAQLGSVAACFTRLGWEVVVASPSGGEVPIDAGTLSEEWFEASTLARRTERLADLSAPDADAWFVLGGHGVLGDLVDDEGLRHLLATAWETGRTVAAVDHGTAVLAGVTCTDGAPLVSGLFLTGRTDLEERSIRHLGIAHRTAEQLLRSAGARFSSANPWQPHVVVDQHVVTGQNPASATRTVGAVAEQVDELLQAA